MPLSAESQARKTGGVAAPSPAVEVRRCGSHGDEANIDVEVAADAGHVAEQAPVAIDGVGRRLAREPDERTRREQSLRQGRGLRAVALPLRVDLGCVDLDKSYLRPVREIDGVAVHDVIDATELTSRDRGGRRRAPGDREQG